MDKVMFQAASTGDYSQAPARLAGIRSSVLASVIDVSRRTTALNLITELETKVNTAVNTASHEGRALGAIKK